MAKFFFENIIHYIYYLPVTLIKKKYVEIKIRYEIKIHLQYMQIGRRTVFGTE